VEVGEAEAGEAAEDRTEVGEDSKDAEVVRMVTEAMGKMVTVEAVVEAAAEAGTGMETLETVNFVLAIAVETREDSMIIEDLEEVNEVTVEATGEATVKMVLSKRMETKS